LSQSWFYKWLLNLRENHVSWAPPATRARTRENKMIAPYTESIQNAGGIA